MGQTYAIAVSFDPDRLASHQLTGNEAQGVVETALAALDFTVLLQGLYVGTSGMDAVRAIVTVQDLAERFVWFAPCVRAARLLRIEEDGDLTIALK